jgi:hypothetical protein
MGAYREGAAASIQVPGPDGAVLAAAGEYRGTRGELDRANGMVGEVAHMERGRGESLLTGSKVKDVGPATLETDGQALLCGIQRDGKDRGA